MTTSWTEGDVTTNGVKLHYYRMNGKGDRAQLPLVLSHGITDNGLCWIRAAEILQKNYDVIMVDARGHGLSDKPSANYSSDIHAADLAGFIQQFGLDKPILMGHSMGAATTAALAANYPDLVGRIILEDPPWRADAETPTAAKEREAGMKQWRDNLAERQNLSQEEIADEGRQANPKWDDVEFAPWSLAKKQVSLDVFTYRVHTRTNWRDLVERITCPTLLVTADAELGAIVNKETSQEASSLNANIQIAHISDAGHNIRREQFEAFMEAVEHFLTERDTT
ncbi:alpha/beta hydrolase [Chloroflexi bacterium TSY]|nr:alpha/beta hydrolase [Chloroflexi bacterium TSY]